MPFGILSAGMLAACVACRAQLQSQVYAQGIYDFGTTWYCVSSTAVPFKYDLTEISWSQDKDGLPIVSLERKPAPGDTARRCLEVQSGSEDFFLPLDSGTPRTPFVSTHDPPVAPTIPPVVKISGDFASAVTRCATNRGGRTTTNAVPALQASWVCGSGTNEDIFILQGDHFVEIQNVLEQAYGKPDASIRSSYSAGGDNCSIYYSPAQVGVLLNLARTWDDTTIVSIIGNRHSKD